MTDFFIIWVVLEIFLLWGRASIINFPNTGEGNSLYYEPRRVYCTFPAFFLCLGKSITISYLQKGKWTPTERSFIGSRVSCTTWTIQSLAFHGNLGLLGKLFVALMQKCHTISSTFEDDKLKELNVVLKCRLAECFYVFRSRLFFFFWPSFSSCLKFLCQFLFGLNFPYISTCDVNGNITLHLLIYFTLIM